MFEKMKASNEAVKKAQLARDKENAKKGGNGNDGTPGNRQGISSICVVCQLFAGGFPGMIDEAVSGGTPR
ncbi:MAG: hypothetical protein ACLS29_08230 [Prevotellamassilia sp.]